MTGYFVEPTSVLPDMSGQSEVIGKDCRYTIDFLSLKEAAAYCIEYLVKYKMTNDLLKKAP